VFNNSSYITCIAIIISSYAPWCPACQQFEGDWISLAYRMAEYDVKIAKVDITAQNSE